jgi:hypothetical protein
VEPQQGRQRAAPSHEVAFSLSIVFARRACGGGAAATIGK